MEQHKRMLPDKLVDHQVKEDFLKKVKEDAARINELVQKIRKVSPFKVQSVDELMQLTPDYVEQFFADAIDSYLGTKYVPADLQQMARESFARDKEEVMPFVEALAVETSRSKFGMYMRQDGTFGFRDSEVNKAAEEAATFRYTEEEKQYYTMLGAAVDAIYACAEWEKQHGFLPFSSKGSQVININPETGMPFFVTTNLSEIIGKGIEWNRETFLWLNRSRIVGKK